ncbi:M48 metallopeptidase family protein [Shewanella gelidii]|uniref:YgjP-like metallopeptidase domain-containing protein n=1 Tax=Shewanella gelidii TaxID=1642821 RepID=A0A917N9N8_9GAMM|nr:M48 family metallopeptidase [Shewanella gelidii]MCL1097484.1 M48 family metallopeptidase [Shewanella gelidii]GGI75590.1 hypothetical protein GCM10009332_11280 [Shewanella gelidii]
MLKYLNGYPTELQSQVKQLLADGKLGALLLKKYPSKHQFSSNKALYDLTIALKNKCMRQSASLAKVTYDDKIQLSHHALGLHSYVSRIQGKKVKSKNEIRIASSLKQAPESLLKMVIVHELAHLKEKQHNKAFYQLCCHMESDYHQLEFDLRLLLILMDLGQNPYADK